MQPREALWGPTQSVAHSRADLAESGRTGRRRGYNMRQAVGDYLLFLVTVLNTSRFNPVMPETPSLLSPGLATYETGGRLGRVK